jgi:ATP-dependent RNA helicase DDX46/PRP5
LFAIDLKENDRKLYLYIEGPTQKAVVKAKAEIEGILREELHTQATTYQPQTMQRLPGRYKVLSLTN